ncbi:MAG: hypothetical protein ACQ9MH_25965 [Nitrospinales bacterium]
MNRLLALALTVVVLTLANSVLAGSEEWCGTWINMDYENNSRRATRFIVKPDGKFEQFRSADSKLPVYEGTYKIDEKWTDSAGNIFYKCQYVDKYGKNIKNLTKLSESGKVLEYVWGYDEYPTEVTPRPGYYSKYFRE